MEEKKLDKNSIIGFILIFGIMMFWLWQNSPTPEELEARKSEARTSRSPKKGRNTTANKSNNSTRN